MSRRSQYECECECECEGEGEGEGDYDYDCGTRRDIDGDSISSWGMKVLSSLTMTCFLDYYEFLDSRLITQQIWTHIK